MATKKSTATKSATKSTAVRAKTVAGKIAPRAQALTGEEGARLRKLKAKAERGAALTPEQRADLKDLEHKRIARNLYGKQLRERAAAAKAAAKAPAAKAPAAPVLTARAVLRGVDAGIATDTPHDVVAIVTSRGTEGLSKSDVLGALRAAIAVERTRPARTSETRAACDALSEAARLVALLKD